MRPRLESTSLARVRYEVVDLHAEQLLVLVAEHLKQRGVSLQDALGLGVEEVDALGGLLYHRPVALLAPSQLLLCPLALGDLLLRLLVEFGVVHRQGRPTGELLGHPEIRLLKAPTRLRRDQRDRTQNLPPRHQRNCDQGREGHLAQEPQVFLFAGGGLDHLFCDLGVELGPAASQDLRRSLPGPRVGWVATLELVGQPYLLGILMLHS